MSKPAVLILCTGNSCRSQMAEGILRACADDVLTVHSAGSKPAGYVHPLAIEVMREIGIDISGHESKSLDRFRHSDFSMVVTVCGAEDTECAAFPGDMTRHHWPFDDPPKAVRPGETEIEAFRRVRDEIRRVFKACAAGYRLRMKVEDITPSRSDSTCG